MKNGSPTLAKIGASRQRVEVVVNLQTFVSRSDESSMDAYSGMAAAVRCALDCIRWLGHVFNILGGT